MQAINLLCGSTFKLTQGGATVNPILYVLDSSEKALKKLDANAVLPKMHHKNWK